MERSTKLTQKQADALIYIKSFIKVNGYPPSRIEIADNFDIRPNAAQSRIVGLITKGAITQKPGKMRSISPVKGFKVRIKQ